MKKKPAVRPLENPITIEGNSLFLNLGQEIFMEMVRIPAGSFWMGDQKTSSSQVAHRVELDEFWLGKYPVTNAQYRLFTGETGYRGEPDFGFPPGKDQHPVINISWRDAYKFTLWLHQKRGEKLPAYEVRLPTEAEWERAARGTDSRTYPWGETPPDPSLCNFNRQVGSTTPVGSYSPQGDSPYGCADMAGNVWEWTSDWYNPQYYTISPVRNPQGPETGRLRTLRGGCWIINENGIQTFLRGNGGPSGRCNYVGFRCALAFI